MIKMDVMWTEFIWPRTNFSSGFCEHDNKPSGSIKSGEFRD